MSIKSIYFLAIYTSDTLGDDETGDGSEGKPFKTILQAMRKAGFEPFPLIYVDGKDLQKYEEASKSQMKKIQKIWTREKYKQDDKTKKETEDAEKRNKNLEEAKKIIIVEDKSLPEAVKVKISDGKFQIMEVWIYVQNLSPDQFFLLQQLSKFNFPAQYFREKRIKVFGWVHRIRRQGKNLMFVTLRDGTGFLQSILNDKVCQIYNALVLQTESSVVLYGTPKMIPEGKTVSINLF